jgi:hypothetical protein
MSEPAVEERRSWASDVVWVAFYSILVLLLMLLWHDTGSTTARSVDEVALIQAL